MASALTVFRAELTSKMAPQFELVLPPHLPIDRLNRTIINAVSGNKKLLDADRASLWQACMTSAVLGLEPDGVTGQGHLVPFRGKVQFIPGYRGLVTLAFNAGYIVEGHVVRALDEFDYAYGLSPRLLHKPSRSHERGDKNAITAAYATARSPSMPAVFEVVELPDILRIRNKSSGYQYALSKNKTNPDSPWANDFAAMARKTPIRMLASHLPLQVQKAVALETLHDRGAVANARKEGADIVIDHEAIDDDEGVAASDDGIIEGEFQSVDDVIDDGAEIPFDDD